MRKNVVTFSDLAPNHRPLAQLGERLFYTQEVTGSKPVGSTVKEVRLLVDDRTTASSPVGEYGFHCNLFHGPE